MAQPISGVKSYPSSVGCGDYSEKKKDVNKGKCSSMKGPKLQSSGHGVVFRTPVEVARKPRNIAVASVSVGRSPKTKLFKSSSCECLSPKPVATPRSWCGERRQRPLQVPYRGQELVPAMPQPAPAVTSAEDRERSAARVICRALMLHAWRRRRHEAHALTAKVSALQAEGNNLRRQKSVLKSLVASETARMAQVTTALTKAEEALNQEQRAAEFLRREKAQMEEEVSSLRSRLEESATHVNNLKNTVLATQAEAQVLEAALNRERDKLQALRGEKHELEQQVQCAEELSVLRAEALSEIEDRFNAVQLSAEHSASQISVLEEERSELEGKLRRLEDDRSELQEKIVRLEEEKEELACLEREREERESLEAVAASTAVGGAESTWAVIPSRSWAQYACHMIRRAPLLLLHCVTLALLPHSTYDIRPRMSPFASAVPHYRAPE